MIKLTPQRVEPLTDRACTRLLGGLIGCLCGLADPENVKRAVQWWAENPEAIDMIATSEANTLARGYRGPQT